MYHAIEISDGFVSVVGGRFTAMDGTTGTIFCFGPL